MTQKSHFMVDVRQVVMGGFGTQIQKILQFAKVFEKKIQKKYSLNLLMENIKKSPQKISSYAPSGRHY